MPMLTRFHFPTLFLLVVNDGLASFQNAQIENHA